eukprot:10766-Heterococcus_DN1.PRE.1
MENIAACKSRISAGNFGFIPSAIATNAIADAGEMQQVSHTDPLTFFFACKSLAMSSGIACKTPVAISSIMLAQGWLDCYSSESNLEQS